MVISKMHDGASHVSDSWADQGLLTTAMSVSLPLSLQPKQSTAGAAATMKAQTTAIQVWYGRSSQPQLRLHVPLQHHPCHSATA